MGARGGDCEGGQRTEDERARKPTLLRTRTQVDFLIDSAASSVMQYLVDDRPHFTFCVKAARPHMHREVAFFYGTGVSSEEESIRGQAAFDSYYDKLARNSSRNSFASR